MSQDIEDVWTCGFAGSGVSFHFLPSISQADHCRVKSDAVVTSCHAITTRTSTTARLDCGVGVPRAPVLPQTVRFDIRVRAGKMGNVSLIVVVAQQSGDVPVQSPTGGAKALKREHQWLLAETTER
jgi:hypothetical protein